MNKLSKNFFFTFISYIILLFALSGSCIPATHDDVIARFNLTFDNEIKIPECFLPCKKITKPKVGITLSGGGFRGICQIGVLKVLVENNIPIDYVVGTSIGSVIGGLFASGYSPDEMWKESQKINWNEIFNDSPKRSAQFIGEKQKRARSLLHFRLDGLKPVLPEAFTPGQRLNDVLTNIFLNAPYHSQNFNDLPVPLKIVATDLLSGNKIVFDKGYLIEAIRASIAIPLLLTPVEMDSMILVDGGLLDNIPVKETRDSGADIVIAVNTTALLRKREEMTAAWEIADQVTTLMQKEHNENQLKMADIVIDFKDIKTKSTEVESIDYLYQEGINRAQSQLENIKNVIAEKKQSQNKYTKNQHYNIHNIHVRGAENIDINSIIHTTSKQIKSKSDILFCLEHLFKSGYFSDVKAEIVKNGSQEDIYYHLIQNPVLKKIVFFGNTVFSDSTLMSYFISDFGKPINNKFTRQRLQDIIKLYRDKSYSLAEISKSLYFEESGTAFVYINEGKISGIQYSGIKKTKTFVIAREFTMKEGELFQLAKANTGLNNVYGTGLFRSVSLKTVKNKNEWEVDLDLHENRSNVLRLGSRYDDERKIKGFIEVSDENILGTGNEFTVHALYGNKNLNAYLDFRADRIFKTYLTANFNLHHNRGKYFTYGKVNSNSIGEYERRATGFSLSVGQQIERFGTLSGIMKSEQINVRSISGIGYDSGKLLINTLGFNTLVDTRDQVPFPRNGKFHKFFYEVSSGTLLGGDISYFKVASQLSGFRTFGRRHTISPKVIWSTSDLTTPFSEQFRIGGRESFYGLREGELQGRHLILGSLEYRYFIPWNSIIDIYLSARYDGGAVWENAIEVDSKDFINGKGLAITFKTPLGPVSFAYGRASNQRERFYFSAGYIF